MTASRIPLNVLFESMLRYCSRAEWRSLENMCIHLNGCLLQNQLNPTLELVLLACASLRERNHLNSDIGAFRKVTRGNETQVLMIEIALHHLGIAQKDIILERYTHSSYHCDQFLRLLRMVFREMYPESGVGKSAFISSHLMVSRLRDQYALKCAIDSGKISKDLTFILGMHRSGTSALAGSLCQSYFDPPNDPMPPTEANPKGYWESQGVFLLNEELLRQLGVSWDSVSRLPEGWEDFEVTQSWRSKLLKHLMSVFDPSKHPLVKDPRFCILLPGLTPWIESGLLRVNFLLQLRHPYEVAESLHQREQVPVAQALLLWLHYTFEAENSTRGFRRIFVSYDRLVDHPSQVVNECIAVLHGSQEGDYTRDVTNKFVDKSLRHQYCESVPSQTWKAIASTGTLDDMAIRVFELLTSKALQQPPPCEAIDRLREMYILAASAYEYQNLNRLQNLTA